MIRVSIVGTEEVVHRFRALTASTTAKLRTTVERLALTLVGNVKRDKLTGQVLNVRTGRLRRSIHHEIDARGSSVVATVGTNVEYAKFHEYGLGRMPERSFLRSSLREMRDQIRHDLKAAVRGSL